MTSLTLAQVAADLSGELIGDAEHCARENLTSVSTDTRTIKKGATFVALTGPNHDGHEHIASAVEKGANALVVSRKVSASVPQIVVADTLLALGALAKLWVSIVQVPIIAITGSNGKTTVKEMVKSILAELGPVLATRGNLNNEIGAPLTLLKIREEHRYAVIEMGANHKGEIGYLSNLAEPHVALVNNVSSAHLEGFGSVQDVADAKSEIYAGVSSHGFAVINIDDPYADVMHKAANHCSRINYSSKQSAQIFGQFEEGLFKVKTPSFTVELDLPLLGAHNRQNALAAIAICSCLDVSANAIRAGLEKVQPVPGRLQRQTGSLGVTLIDDSYNANPASARAAIDVLAEQSGLRVFVLGDMLELGALSERLHAELGDRAREKGIDLFYTVGPLAAHAAHAFGESGVSFHKKSQLIDELKKLRSSTTTILIKGSRGSRMEEVVQALLVKPKNGSNSEVLAT